MELREWLLKRQIVIRRINFGSDNLNLNPRQVEMSPAQPPFPLSLSIEWRTLQVLMHAGIVKSTVGLICNHEISRRNSFRTQIHCFYCVFSHIHRYIRWC